jgi:hypothetical protein
MTTYKVYFRSDLQSGRHDFDAETPEQALALAQRFAEEQWDVLDLDYYEACDCPINEIEVCDADYNLLTVWLDDDMRLRLAARDMLAALQAISKWWTEGLPASQNGEDEMPAEIFDAMRFAIAKAKGGDA